MFTIELASLFRNIITLPQRDDQRLCKVSRVGVRTLSRSALALAFPSTMTLQLTKAGFNTTFGFLARGTFTFREMSWILIKVFFGSSYLGFVRAVLFCLICYTSLTQNTHRMLLNRYFQHHTRFLQISSANLTKISPTMGPPLMLVFCVATNFLLLTILICLLSKSYDKV